MAGKSNTWTAARRARQSQWMKENRPWEKSTGPTTAAGKQAVKNNAYQHGFCSADYAEILRLLKLQDAFAKSLNADANRGRLDP